MFTKKRRWLEWGDRHTVPVLRRVLAGVAREGDRGSLEGRSPTSGRVCLLHAFMHAQNDKPQFFQKSDLLEVVWVENGVFHS
jgi:hypothetical protein